MESNVNQRLNGLNVLAYLGANAAQPPNFVAVNRAPTIGDSKGFQLGAIWLNTAGYPGTIPGAESIYFLVALIGNQATWVALAGTSALETLTGNSGGPISGDVNDNINIVTANATVKFVGSGNSLTQDFNTGTNFALGSTLPSLTSGTANLFIGAGVGSLVTSGSFNTIVSNNGTYALSTGVSNVFIGDRAGSAITTEVCNIIVGPLSLGGPANGTGATNTVVGWAALSGAVTAANSNIVIGFLAASGFNSNESFNIILGLTGTGHAGDQNRIRIGDPAVHTGGTFVAGVQGTNVGSVATVVTAASNRLGTASIAGGTGISVVPAANLITISSTGGGFTWADTTVDASIVAGNGYIANKPAALLTMTLPASPTLGQMFAITNINIAVGWRIAQNAGQKINIGNASTTVGVLGYLESLALGDTVTCVCIVGGASAFWQVVSMVGNITVA